MGTIVPRKQKSGTRYRAQIRIKKDGQIIHSESETFSKRTQAQAWLNKREAELEQPGAIDAKKHKGVTIGALIKRYIAEVMSAGEFGRTKLAHLKQLEGMPIADIGALSLTTQDVVEHIQWRRSDGAGPATVSNDLIWLRVVFKYAKAAWGIPLVLDVIQDAADTARAARLIGRPKRRDRRPEPEELEKLDAHFRKQRFRSDGTSPPMRYLMWFAIYSCRRQEEICSILRSGMDRPSSTYEVNDLKHPEGSAGNDKLALMPPRGWEVVDAILRDIPSDELGRLLPFNEKTVSAAFTRACHVLGIKNLRYHDLRHEGASRLAEDGATIPEIQQVTLHESWSSLQVYVNMRGKRQRRVDFVDIKPPSNPSSPRTRGRRDTVPAR